MRSEQSCMYYVLLRTLPGGIAKCGGAARRRPLAYQQRLMQAFREKEKENLQGSRIVSAREPPTSLVP